LPALLEADAEPGFYELDLGAHDPRQDNVADPIVHRIRPVDPALLHQTRLEAELGSDRGDLPRVVRLHAADRDQMRGALSERVGNQVLELAGLVATEGEPGVAVLTLGPDAGTAEVLGEPVERMDRARPEQQWIE